MQVVEFYNKEDVLEVVLSTSGKKLFVYGRECPKDRVIPLVHRLLANGADQHFPSHELSKNDKVMLAINLLNWLTYGEFEPFVRITKGEVS